jgi:uncharacterized protein YcbX
VALSRQVDARGGASEAELTERGLAGDRARAVVDGATGQVASAKEPRRWKRLLTCVASGAGEDVVLELPGGERARAADPDVDERLSALLGRPVALLDAPPPAAELQRAVPEEVLRRGSRRRSRRSPSCSGRPRRPGPSSTSHRCT